MGDDYFRQLYGGVLERNDIGRYLTGEERTAAQHLVGLDALRKREPVPTVDDEQLWKLYALSRVSDFLIERSSLEPYIEFFSGIGLAPSSTPRCSLRSTTRSSPSVQDPSVTSVTVEEVLWPGFWFGDLLFSRAGVRVRAPQHLIDASVATTSTLYFTFRREPRRANDLSHGWGSNSQWRTSFTRFYSDADGLHLNWDGTVDIGNDLPPDPSPVEQRRELLLHRCFVRGPLPPDEHDRFPYDDRLSLSTSEWPLRPESIIHVK